MSDKKCSNCGEMNPDTRLACIYCDFAFYAEVKPAPPPDIQAQLDGLAIQPAPAEAGVSGPKVENTCGHGFEICFSNECDKPLGWPTKMRKAYDAACRERSELVKERDDARKVAIEYGKSLDGKDKLREELKSMTAQYQLKVSELIKERDQLREQVTNKDEHIQTLNERIERLEAELLKELKAHSDECDMHSETNRLQHLAIQKLQAENAELRAELEHRNALIERQGNLANERNKELTAAREEVERLKSQSVCGVCGGWRKADPARDSLEKLARELAALPTDYDFGQKSFVERARRLLAEGK